MNTLTAYYNDCTSKPISYSEAKKLWMNHNKCYPKEEQKEIRKDFNRRLKSEGYVLIGNLSIHIIRWRTLG
jgi:hypothetical protein